MRYAIVFLLCLPGFASAQTPEIEAALKAKLATLKFLSTLYDAEGGGYAPEPKGNPGLRATNAAVKATKSLGGKLVDPDKTTVFVLSRYDANTGGFAEPGGKPDVTTTCIGVMAAVELGIPKEQIAKAKTFIEATAKVKVFEDVRIAAAAVEAWGGPKGWTPKVLEDWFKTAFAENVASVLDDGPQDSVRACAAADVAAIRLGYANTVRNDDAVKNYRPGQRADGGWGKPGEKASDVESVYRVMRFFAMAKTPPTDAAKLRAFIGKHRNDDGGYATKPGEKSSASGTYYAVTVTKWLDELEKK